MIKRTVEISTEGCRLFVKNDQLVVEQNDNELGQVPCEDLGILLIDAPHSSCSFSALSSVAEAGGVVVVCGRDRNPTGILWPIAANQLLAERVNKQAAFKETTKNQLWRLIVIAKLKNQADVLPADSPMKTKLLHLAGKVKSGDPENVEGQAAALYWPAMFPDIGFKRHRKGKPPNNLLNYGYAILRATVVRSICAAGLHPSFGLHHRNKLDQFRLADDLMEPFRPTVDKRVKIMFDSGVREMDPTAKRRILSMLTERVNLKGEQSPLMVAVQKTIDSYVDCINGKSKSLKLPSP